MSADTAGSTGAPTSGSQKVIGTVAWLWVGLPFLYGLIALITKIPALFAPGSGG